MKTNVEIMSRKAMNVLIESGFAHRDRSIKVFQHWKEQNE